MVSNVCVSIPTLHPYKSAAEREQDASDRAAAAKLATAAATEVGTIHQSTYLHIHPFCCLFVYLTCRSNEVNIYVSSTLVRLWCEIRCVKITTVRRQTACYARRRREWTTMDGRRRRRARRRRRLWRGRWRLSAPPRWQGGALLFPFQATPQLEAASRLLHSCVHSSLSCHQCLTAHRKPRAYHLQFLAPL